MAAGSLFGVFPVFKRAFPTTTGWNTMCPLLGQGDRARFGIAFARLSLQRVRCDDALALFIREEAATYRPQHTISQLPGRGAGTDWSTSGQPRECLLSQPHLPTAVFTETMYLCPP